MGEKHTQKQSIETWNEEWNEGKKKKKKKKNKKMPSNRVIPKKNAQKSHKTRIKKKNSSEMSTEKSQKRVKSNERWHSEIHMKHIEHSKTCRKTSIPAEKCRKLPSKSPKTQKSGEINTEN